MAKDCCWNCRYYIPPLDIGPRIDGPVSSVCTIDRRKDIYPDDMYLTEGDKHKDPGDWCKRYEDKYGKTQS